jgi:hypothetical protein
MHITQAEYINLDGYPFLRMIVDGKEALIGQFKWPLLEKGYVPLHSRDEKVDWSQILPVIHIDGIDLEGFTDDPVIIEMARKYWKAINHLEGESFKIGPVNFGGDL